MEKNNTEQLKYDNKLRESEEKFRSLFENSPFGILICELLRDDNGNAIDFIHKQGNNSTSKQTGFDLDDLIGKKASELVDEETLSVLLNRYESVVKNGKSINFNEYYEIYDKTLDVTAFHLVNELFIVNFVDVSERVKSERAIFESKENLNLALKGANAGLWSWNIKTGEDLLDERWCGIFGYKKEELEQHVSTWERLIHPDDKSRIFDVVQKHFENEANEYNHEYRMKCKNGAWKWIHAIGKVVERDGEGKPYRMTGIIIDIDDRKKSEILLEESKKRIEESEKKFKTLFKDNSLTQLLIDPETGNIIDVNQAACEFYGYSYEELTTLNIHEINISSKEDIEMEMKNAKEKKKNFFEFQHKLHDGTIRFVEVYSNPIMVDNDEYLISNIHDVSARKTAESNLRDSEIRFKALHNASFGGIAIHDKGLILECNNGLSEITAYDRDELIGMDGLLLISDDTRDMVMRNIQAAYENPYEAKGIRKNGEVYPLRLEAREIPYKGKKVRVVEFRDITEQKEAENKLRESEEMLRNIFNNSTSVIYSHDINNVVNYVSPRIEEVLGYTQDEAKVNWTNLLSDNPLNEIAYQNTIKAIETGEKQEAYELEFLHKSGKKVIVEAREAPVVRNGKTVSIVGIFNDITERKHIEDEFRLLVKRHQLATESADIGIWELDLKKNVLVWDKQMFDLYGIKPEDFGGAYEAWKAGVHPDDIERSDREVQAAIVGEKDFHTQFRVIWPNGEIHYIEAQALIIKDPDGVPESMIGVNWNITERIKAEQELIEAKERAEESDRLKSAFLANMSHEIRTPMNGILGFTELLKKPNLTGEQKEKYIDIIKRSGDRMLDTVNDIIDISKIDADQVEMSKSDVFIHEELETQYEFFNREASLKGIELLLINNLQKNSTIVTDKLKLESIFSNLIKNAIKYTDQGTIEIVCSRKDSMLEFSITDTGIGIPSNRIGSIFNRFEQADIEDARAHEGSGLGLSIAKAYVEMLGGSIDVISKIGVGSTFSFTLPWVEKKQVDKYESIKEKKRNTNYNKINILIAEDDDISFEHLEVILESKALSLVRTVTGKEAVEYVKNNTNVDLILMDVKMPIMDGYEATKAIRKFNKDVIIIAQTAYALIGDREKAIAAGCNDYITKPIDHQLLVEIIVKHMK